MGWFRAAIASGLRHSAIHSVVFGALVTEYIRRLIDAKANLYYVDGAFREINKCYEGVIAEHCLMSVVKKVPCSTRTEFRKNDQGKRCLVGGIKKVETQGNPHCHRTYGCREFLSYYFRIHGKPKGVGYLRWFMELLIIPS